MTADDELPLHMVGASEQSSAFLVKSTVEAVFNHDFQDSTTAPKLEAKQSMA